jgi:Protein of unknown function (DUF3306)
MSEPESTAKAFLLRWSQRKHAAQQHAEPAPAPDEESRNDAGDPPHSGSEGEAAPLAFDPQTLPPIESIGAVSDVRAFLAPGVPEELTRAALRRAWVSDPTIRDFVGIAENQWDFTQADGVPGFGSLQLTPQLRQMIADLIGDTGGEGGPGAHARRDQPEADTAEYSTPPTSCAESGQQQEASLSTPGALPPQSAGVADVSIRPSADDHAAAQQRRGRDTVDDTMNNAASDRPPRRHGSAVPK